MIANRKGQISSLLEREWLHDSIFLPATPVLVEENVSHHFLMMTVREEDFHFWGDFVYGKLKNWCKSHVYLYVPMIVVPKCHSRAPRAA